MESPDEIEEQLSRARSGDRASFESLVRSQHDQLDRYVRLRLGTHLREYVEVDDVVQETYTRAFESIENFQLRGADSFLRWLRRVAENVILELARKQRRHSVLFLDRDVAGPDMPPSQSIRREERFDRFQSAVNGLPADYREVVLLSRIQGLRTKEIAEKMDRSPKAVAHLLSRAMMRLKDIFGETESFRLPPLPLEDGGLDDG